MPANQAGRPTLLRLRALTMLVLTFAASMPSLAAQRSFVRSDGVDTGTCSLAAPCRSFNFAIGQTSAGGEVIILDTAGYGTMVIDKAITIIGPAGVYGGISVLGGVNPTIGILINAGDTDDVTLRGLDVNGVSGAVPAPLIGIHILNAGAVHIEKSSISNFPEDGGACINLATAKTVRLYVDDSFLRRCVRGIHAFGTAVSGNRSSVIIDNTRIERGFASNPATGPIGLFLEGFLAVSLRNSLISRADVAVQVQNGLPGSDTTLSVIDSELTNVNYGLYFFGSVPSVRSEIRIVGSQLTNMNGDGVRLFTSGAGSVLTLTVSGTRIEDLANAVTLVTNAANARVSVDMDTSQVANNLGGISMTATGGGACYANVRESTLAQLGTAIKTLGTNVSASLIRSQVNNCAMVLDHGAGVVRLESNHITNCADGFVNNGSGNVESNGQNMVRGVANASGFTYITPTPVGLQ